MHCGNYPIYDKNGEESVLTDNVQVALRQMRRSVLKEPIGGKVALSAFFILVFKMLTSPNSMIFKLPMKLKQSL